LKKIQNDDIIQKHKRAQMTENVSEEQLKKAVIKYFNSVKEVFNKGSRNIETTYSNPIIVLFEAFGCKPVDVSGGRSKKSGENIDIELWHSDDDINKIEPFAAIEIKK
jgi:hypothetical protein